MDLRSNNRLARGITRRSVLQRLATGVAVGAITVSATGRAIAQKYDGQTLNWMVTQPRIGAAKKLKEMFEAQTGATIEITAVPYDAVEAQATLDVQSGANKFDVVDYWYASIGALTTNEVLVDITGNIDASKDEIKPEDFLPAFYDKYTLYDGKRYGLPWDGDSHSLYYNQEILDRNGLAVPVTWDDYYNVAKTITEAEGASNGVYGAVIMGVNIPVALGSIYVNRMAGFGGRFLTEDGGSALLEEAQIKSAKAMEDVIPYCFPTPAEVGFENGIPAFISGSGAMIEFWTDLGIVAENDENSKIQGKWGVTSIPVGDTSMSPQAPMNAGWALGIMAGSNKADLAWEFIKFSTDPDVQLEVSSTPGTFSDPVRTSVLTSDAYKAFAPKVQAAFEAAANTAMPWPTIPESPTMMRALTDELAKMMAGQQNHMEMLENADRKWKRILG